MSNDKISDHDYARALAERIIPEPSGATVQDKIEIDEVRARVRKGIEEAMERAQQTSIKERRAIDVHLHYLTLKREILAISGKKPVQITTEEWRRLRGLRSDAAELLNEFEGLMAEIEGERTK